jgi:hypothetical protein
MTMCLQQASFSLKDPVLSTLVLIVVVYLQNLHRPLSREPMGAILGPAQARGTWPDHPTTTTTKTTRTYNWTDCPCWIDSRTANVSNMLCRDCS